MGLLAFVQSKALWKFHEKTQLASLTISQSSGCSWVTYTYTSTCVYCLESGSCCVVVLSTDLECSKQWQLVCQFGRLGSLLHLDPNL